jgi:hypothetical protein
LHFNSGIIVLKIYKLKLITKYTADTRTWKQGGDEEGESDKRVAASMMTRQRETLYCALTYLAEKKDINFLQEKAVEKINLAEKTNRESRLQIHSSHKVRY